jgi:hypothetical protein
MHQQQWRRSGKKGKRRCVKNRMKLSLPQKIDGAFLRVTPLLVSKKEEGVLHSNEDGPPS